MADILHLSLQGCNKLPILLIFLYNAKPSFDIAKWIANNTLWQNMKIIKTIQKALHKFKTYLRLTFTPKGGRPLRGRPVLVKVFE